MFPWMLMLFPAFHVLFIADIMSSVYPIREPFKKKFGEFHTWGWTKSFSTLSKFFLKIKGGVKPSVEQVCLTLG